MATVALCLETSQIISPHRDDLAIDLDMHPRGFVCVGCQQPMIFVAAGYRKGVVFPDTSAIKTAHFRHLDPDVERTCTYTSSSAPESQKHLMLKQLQQERFQKAIDINCEHDGLLLVPEKTIKSEGIHRRPDVSLLRNGKVFSGSEIQVSSMSPTKLWERANDHEKLGIKKLLWTLGDNASHSLETCLNLYGKAQTLRVRTEEVPFVADNGFIYQEERILGVDFEVWNLEDWNNRNLSNTAELATLESDCEFIEQAILESERPVRKTFELPTLAKKRHTATTGSQRSVVVPPLKNICDNDLPFSPGDRVNVTPLAGGRGGEGVLKLVRGFGSLAIAEVVRDDGLLLHVPLATVKLQQQ